MPTLIDPNSLHDLRAGTASTRVRRHNEQLMGAQVSSFPLGSSAGGFSWTFDPALGSFSRAQPQLRPGFLRTCADDRQTSIECRVQLPARHIRQPGGEGSSRRRYQVLLWATTSVGPFSVFFEDSLDLKMSTDTVGLFATYGVTDRLDLGIAIPIMNVQMRAALTTRDREQRHRRRSRRALHGNRE